MQRSDDDPADDSDQHGTGSMVHLLAVWLLVGFSLMGLGSDLVTALSLTLPSLGGGLVFGTVVVCTAWLVGARPSIRASAAYFVAQLGAHLLLSFLAVGVGLSLGNAWVLVGVRVASIAAAAGLVVAASRTDTTARLLSGTRSALDSPSSTDEGDGQV